MNTRGGVKMSVEDATLYDSYKEKANYNDRMQYIFKIKLNS